MRMQDRAQGLSLSGSAPAPRWDPIQILPKLTCRTDTPSCRTSVGAPVAKRRAGARAWRGAGPGTLPPAPVSALAAPTPPVPRVMSMTTKQAVAVFLSTWWASLSLRWGRNRIRNRKCLGAEVWHPLVQVLLVLLGGSGLVALLSLAQCYRYVCFHCWG